MEKEQNLYLNLFQNIETGVIYQDIQGMIIAANPAAERILGISIDELKGLATNADEWKAIKEDGTPYLPDEHPIMVALKTGKVVRNKIMGVYNPQKKKQIWININAVPEFREGESKPFQTFASFLDVTEKHEIEVQLKNTEEKFKALFENGPIGVAYHKMIYNDKGEAVNYFFLDANENYQKLTGVDPRGKTVTEAFPGIENDPGDWIGTFAKAGRDGQIIRFQQYLEPVDRWYDAVGYQSSPDHFVAAFLEITEQKKKELELERLKNALEDKVRERTKELEKEKENAEAANRAKTAFLANMSHELRTPLNAVLGYAEILSSKETDIERKHYLHSISTSGNALLSLINDVLDLAKIETGKFELQHTIVSLSQILEELKIIFNQKIVDKGLDFNLYLDPSLPKALLLDEVRLRQILINLVGNAVKFTENGYIAIRCSPYKEIESGRSETHLKIVVEDTGKGIVRSELDRIFNAFTQAKQQKVSEFGGTGLGLAISRNLAELMNGTIEVESKPGKGSAFTLIIKHVEIVSEDVKIERKKLLDPDNTTFEKADVIIIDDIDYNRDMLGTYLKPYGFDLRFAVNGKDALEQINDKKPDIALLDMKMPVMDGYELSKLMKSTPELKDIKIIAVSASSLKEDEIQINKYCDGFLRKPVSRAEIITEMARFIENVSQSVEDNEEAYSTDMKQKRPEQKVLNEFINLAKDGNMDEIIRLADKKQNMDPQYSSFFLHLKQLAIACDESAIFNYLNQ